MDAKKHTDSGLLLNAYDSEMFYNNTTSFRETE